jgi:hypothetical protein
LKRRVCYRDVASPAEREYFVSVLRLTGGGEGFVPVLRLTDCRGSFVSGHRFSDAEKRALRLSIVALKGRGFSRCETKPARL